MPVQHLWAFCLILLESVIWSSTPHLVVFHNLPLYFVLWWRESQPLTSNDRQPSVLRPRHHRSQLGRTQNQHVQKAAVRSHHKHRRVLQVRAPTLHLDPREAQAEEDGSAQQPDDREKEPAAPAGDRSGALLIRQTSQSESGDGPRDEEEKWSHGDAQREEDAAEDDTLWGVRFMKYLHETPQFLWILRHLNTV